MRYQSWVQWKDPQDWMNGDKLVYAVVHDTQEDALDQIAGSIRLCESGMFAGGLVYRVYDACLSKDVDISQIYEEAMIDVAKYKETRNLDDLRLGLDKRKAARLSANQ